MVIVEIDCSDSAERNLFHITSVITEVLFFCLISVGNEASILSHWC